MGERPKRQPKDNRDPNFIYTPLAREARTMAVTKEDLEKIFEKFNKKIDDRCQTLGETIKRVGQEHTKLVQRQEALEEKWSVELRNYKTFVEKEYEEIRKSNENNMPVIEEKIKQAIDKVKKEMSELPLSNNGSGNNPSIENIDITMPRFYGNNRDIHPTEFLVNLGDYFKIKKRGYCDRMLYVKESLHGQAANWFSMMRHSIRTYEEFEQMFLEEYWSRELQFSIWGQFMAADRVRDIKSYTEYFCNWYQKLQYLEVPSLTCNEIITSIAKHYPGHVQAMLVSMPQKTYKDAVNLLKMEDNRTIYKQFANDQRNPFYRNDRDNVNNDRRPDNRRGFEGRYDRNGGPEKKEGFNNRNQPRGDHRNIQVRQMGVNQDSGYIVEDEDDRSREDYYEGPKNEGEGC